MRNGVDYDRQGIQIVVGMGVALGGRYARRGGDVGVGFILPANVAGRTQSEDSSVGQATWVTNLNNDRNLAGLAQDVFFGHVMED